MTKRPPPIELALPSRFLPEQWAETLEQIATNLSLRLAEIEPKDGPSYQTVKGRAFRDPVMRAAFKAAIVRREELSLKTLGRKRPHLGGFQPGFNNKRGRGNAYTREQWQATLEMIATRVDLTLNEINPDGLPSYVSVIKRVSSDRWLRDALNAALARRNGGRTVESGAKTGRGIAYGDAAFRAFIEKVRQCEPGCCTMRTARDHLAWNGLPRLDSVLRREKYRDELRAVLRERGILVSRGGRPNKNAPLMVFREEHYDRALELIGKLTTNRYMEYRAANRGERLPSYQQLYRRAENNPAFRERLYKVRPPSDRETFRYDAGAYDEAVARIGELGWTKYTETREPGVLPSLNAVYRRSARNADYKAKLRRAVIERFRVKAELRALSKVRPAKRPDGQLGQALLRQDAYRIADRFVPRHYDRDDRDDIKADIVMAVLGGEISLDEIGENARWFISEHFRGGIFTSGRFGSLDAPVFEDSDVTYIDRLSSDDYHHLG